MTPLVQGGLEIACVVTVTTDSSFDERILTRFKALTKELYQEPEEPVYSGSAVTDIAFKEVEQPSSSMAATSSSFATLKSRRRKAEKCQAGILRFCTRVERISSLNQVARETVVLSSDSESDYTFTLYN